MSDKQETIDILVIKQDEKPIRKTIPNTLEAKQHEVGGYIEPFGLKNGATIYCNEEGKLGRWTLNRAIRAYDLEDGADSQIVEMMAGTFFISVFSIGIPFGWFRSVQRGFEHEPSVGEIIHTDLTSTVGADGLG